jgi:kumamolisin
LVATLVFGAGVEGRAQMRSRSQPTAPAMVRATAAASKAGEVLADSAPVHIALSLAVTHTTELQALRRAQQDPASPDFRRWLTPAEYGDRFGQPAATYAHVSAWLRAQGLEVTESPNRTFIQARGTAGAVSKALGIRLRHVAGQPAGVHIAEGTPKYPPEIASILVHTSGLDTRFRYHHHLAESGGYSPALGPQDLRAFYDLAPLMSAGYVAQQQQLVVLGTAEPPASAVAPEAIQYFLSNVSDARAKFVIDALPNPQEDLDPGGGNEEFQPDVELQSVGSPGAVSITLVLSPASEVFTVGANEIVTNLSSATAISISLGQCEQNVDPGEAATLQTLITQGTVEGQTWSAATGDNGADDCQDGATVSVDFPASLPEVVAMGGSQVTNPVFDANNAVTGYQQEVLWSTSQNGTSGGGLSTLYSTPSYQTALGVTMRSVPDFVLLAGNPGVAADSSNPFIQTPLAAQLTPFEGTSASSPMSAGIFALIASRLGCRLGDPHAALYALGETDGGFAGYHDITSGTVSADGVTGPSAGPGFDSASGWGSFDVATLAAAFPACPTGDGGYAFDGGIAPEAPYSPCAFIACDGGVDCVTLPEGPSSCEVPCTSSCSPDNICTPGTLFADAGLCVPGCASNADCSSDGGSVCNVCEETCVPPGNPDAGVGAACQSPFDCESSSLCLTTDFNGFTWPDGYCTTFCDPAGVLLSCSCPGTSYCSSATGLCLDSCATPGGPGCRTGYVCQPNGDDTASCQIPCQVIPNGNQSFDTCQLGETPNLACDVDSGVCGGPVVVPDAGPKKEPDVGVDAGTGPDAGLTGIALHPPGCGCGEGAVPSTAALLLALLAFRRRRTVAMTRQRGTGTS